MGFSHDVDIFGPPPPCRAWFSLLLGRLSLFRKPLSEQQRLLDQQRLDEETARSARCPFKQFVWNILLRFLFSSIFGFRKFLLFGRYGDISTRTPFQRGGGGRHNWPKGGTSGWFFLGPPFLGRSEVIDSGPFVSIPICSVEWRRSRFTDSPS